MAKQNISNEVVIEAMKIARSTQKPGQSKEQTQLIAKGIEKGIAEYKKQQKAKARAADKARKQQQKNKSGVETEPKVVTVENTGRSSGIVPWILLILSWIGFAGYQFLL